MKPKMLDLFCKAGESGAGYYLAGFDVTGVDIEMQPNYPFTFIQANALNFDLSGYDVIHASPPCQTLSRTRYFHPDKSYENLIPQTLDMLKASGKPYVVENVVGASIYFDNALLLCGSMFGLRIIRHRLFQSNVYLHAPGYCLHGRNNGTIVGHMFSKKEAKEALGINWMKTRKEFANAIPPAFTQFIGEQIRRVL